MQKLFIYRRLISLFTFLLIFILNATAQQKKRPNIILILADDMGFSDVGCYGGEIKTPNIDRLAAEGIRFKEFYNAARCCPTRASLISGLYPHQAGMGWMAAADLGTPEYQDNLNNNCVTIAEVLKTAGYDTYMSGKWHLTNERKIDGNVTDNWPKQRGFNRYFGIIPGGANYFTPMLYSDNKRYKAPKNFYLTNAIADTSVKFIGDHFAKKDNDPMFMYVAFTSPHWPLHALQKDIDKYKDYYKVGWDAIRAQRFEKQKKLGLFPQGAEISPRDSVIPAWNSIPDAKKSDMAMRMAIYAAQIDIMDQGIGRILAKLKQEGQLDNTLIFFLSDNGACAEFISSGETKEVNGKENSFESYRINWANVSSTPFKEYKHFTYEGGIATPLIVHWPNGISKSLDNSYVKGYGHITDIMATCVDVAHANYPATYHGNTIHPMEGKSIAPAFTGNSLNRGKVFWEHEANIALRDGNWKLVASTPENAKFDVKTLRLYDLSTDPTEMHDLSKKYPEKVKAMYNEWHSWGEKIHVFPMDTREYNVRRQDYNRHINGNFDDNLGGWKIKENPAVKADITIDTTGQISGKKSMKVTIAKAGTKPGAVAANWAFKANKGEKFNVTLTSKATNNAKFYLRLENAKDNSRLIDEQVTVTNKPGTVTVNSSVVPQDGNYRVALYFGDLPAGDEVWVDDIKLIPIK